MLFNGHLFAKFSGCHCLSFMIYNKTHNKSCEGFTLHYSIHENVLMGSALEENYSNIKNYSDN